MSIYLFCFDYCSNSCLAVKVNGRIRSCFIHNSPCWEWFFSWAVSVNFKWLWQWQYFLVNAIFGRVNFFGESSQPVHFDDKLEITAHPSRIFKLQRGRSSLLVINVGILPQGSLSLHALGKLDYVLRKESREKGN